MQMHCHWAHLNIVRALLWLVRLRTPGRAVHDERLRRARGALDLNFQYYAYTISQIMNILCVILFAYRNAGVPLPVDLRRLAGKKILRLASPSMRRARSIFHLPGTINRILCLQSRRARLDKIHFIPLTMTARFAFNTSICALCVPLIRRSISLRSHTATVAYISPRRNSFAFLHFNELSLAPRFVRFKIEHLRGVLVTHACKLEMIFSVPGGLVSIISLLSGVKHSKMENTYKN